MHDTRPMRLSISIFLRPRRVWLPTLWGWLLLAGVGSLLLFTGLRGLADFLTLHDPAHGRDGRGAATLVVEGWLGKSDLDQAIAVFRAGHYQRILTTGGPIYTWEEGIAWKSYAERGASYLQAKGFGPAVVTALPAPASAQDRTYLSAVMVRDWARQAGIDLGAIDVFSAGVHVRRTRLLYRMALGPAVEVGAISSAPDGFDARRWWSNSNDTKTVVGEGLALMWTKCCFWPAPRHSHEERWAVPAPPR